MKKIMLLCLSLLLLSGCSSKITVDSHYDTADKYTQYLKKVKAVYDDIYWEDYVDAEGTQTIDFYNYGPYFYRGEAVVKDINDKKIGLSKIKMGRPNDSYYSEEAYEGVAESVYYQFEMFELTYPDVDFEYETILDYDGEYLWYNIPLDDKCTVDNIMVIAKNQYVMNVLADYYYYYYYFYDETVEYYEDEDVPNFDTSRFSAILDYSEKTIRIYEWVDVDWVEVTFEQMD